MPEGTGAEPEDRALVARAGDLELVTLAEIGRRVGVPTGRVRQLARDDPNWPVPKEQWRRVGRYWQLPWGPIKAYFATRSSRSGPKGGARSRPKRGTESQVLNTSEAAAFLGVDRKILSKWAKEGKVPCQKPGKGYLFSRNALLQWLGGGGADDRVLDTTQAAKFLGVDPKLLSKWAKAGKVPARKPGKGYLYSQNALLRWLAGEFDMPSWLTSSNGQRTAGDTPGGPPGRPRRRGRHVSGAPRQG